MKNSKNSFGKLKKEDKKIVIILEGLRSSTNWPYCNMQCDIDIYYDVESLKLAKDFIKQHNLSLADFSILSCSYACNKFNVKDKGNNLIYELENLIEPYICHNIEEDNIESKDELLINEELYDLIHPYRITDANENAFSFTVRYKLSNTDFLILASAYLNGDIVNSTKNPSRLIYELKRVLLLNKLIKKEENKTNIKDKVKTFIKNLKK